MHNIFSKPRTNKEQYKDYKPGTTSVYYSANQIPNKKTKCYQEEWKTKPVFSYMIKSANAYACKKYCYITYNCSIN